MHSISRAQGFCFTLRIIQKSWSTPAVQIPPKSIWHDPVPFFSPSMHFPFSSVAFYLSIALPPSLSGHFFFMPFLYTFAFSRPLCGCGKLRPAYEVWDKSRLSIRDNVKAWIRPSCEKSESGGCAHIRATLVCISEDLREYWLVITHRRLLPIDALHASLTGVFHLQPETL